MWPPSKGGKRILVVDTGRLVRRPVGWSLRARASWGVEAGAKIDI